MQTGAYNFDIRIDDKENVYFIEMGARNGGDLYPQVIKYATGVDMVEYTIKAALGENCSDLTMVEPKGYWAVYLINSQNSGIFEGVDILEEIQKNIVEYELLVNQGEKISALTGAHAKVGIMILQFSSMEEMLEKVENMTKWVKVNTDNSLVEK